MIQRPPHQMPQGSDCLKEELHWTQHKNSFFSNCQPDNITNCIGYSTNKNNQKILTHTIEKKIHEAWDDNHIERSQHTLFLSSLQHESACSSIIFLKMANIRNHQQIFYFIIFFTFFFVLFNCVRLIIYSNSFCVRNIFYYFCVFYLLWAIVYSLTLA